MCTLSWLPRDGGYLLYFNRDERQDRGAEQPPRLREIDGVRYLAPADSDFGGTWLATNEFGISFAILNRYGITPPEPSTPRVSRGLLILALAGCRGQDELVSRVERTDLSPFAPFTLPCVESGEPMLVLEWDGDAASFHRHREPGLALISSAFRQPEVAQARSRTFVELVAQYGLSAETLERFHRSHLPQRGPESPCMHRDDAETRSFCRVRVGSGQIDFHHEAAAPCLGTLPTIVTLARQASALPLPR